MSDPGSSVSADGDALPPRRVSRGRPTWLLAYAMGGSLGAASAVVAGSFTVGWGLALAPLVTCAVFAFALWRERDERFRHALRFVAGLTIGFVAVLVPTVLIALATPVSQARRAAEVERKAALLRPILTESVVRWSVMATAVPFALWRIRSKRREG